MRSPKARLRLMPNGAGRSFSGSLLPQNFSRMSDNHGAATCLAMTSSSRGARGAATCARLVSFGRPAASSPCAATDAAAWSYSSIISDALITPLSTNSFALASKRVTCLSAFDAGDIAVERFDVGPGVTEQPHRFQMQDSWLTRRAHVLHGITCRLVRLDELKAIGGHVFQLRDDGPDWRRSSCSASVPRFPGRCLRISVATGQAPLDDLPNMPR